MNHGEDFIATLVDFSVFQISTGEIVRHMRCSDIHAIDLQCDPVISPDTGWVFGHHDPATHHVIAGEVQPKPMSH